MTDDAIEAVARAIAEEDDPENWDNPDPDWRREVRDYYRKIAGIAIAAMPVEEAVRQEREASDDRFWIEAREPGCVPDRKGPFNGKLAPVLREFMAARPAAYLTVVNWGHDGPLFRDGPEALQMSDARSMETGRRHIKSCAQAHTAVEEAVRQEREAWRTIDTLPVGAPPVLLIGQYPLQSVTPVWSDIYHGWKDRNGDWSRWPHSFEPTHWMPLPAAPAQATDTQRPKHDKRS